MKKLTISKSFLINFIIASIVPLLILGPFFPDLIVSFSCLIFLFYVFKNNNFITLTIYHLLCFYLFVLL